MRFALLISALEVVLLFWTEEASVAFNIGEKSWFDNVGKMDDEGTSVTGIVVRSGKLTGVYEGRLIRVDGFFEGVTVVDSVPLGLTVGPVVGMGLCIVNDGSLDGTGEVIEEGAFVGVHVEGHRVGFKAAEGAGEGETVAVVW